MFVSRLHKYEYIQGCSLGSLHSRAQKAISLGPGGLLGPYGGVFVACGSAGSVSMGCMMFLMYEM